VAPPAVAPAAGEEAAGEAAPAAAEDGKLAAIKAAGKLVVGTSADYAPYESVDADGNFVGYDMDLIRAIGEKLGVEVEIQDMPFDSLIAAVQEGKIDAVIAAMQATAERDEQVDFTIPYRMTKDAFVAAGDSTLVIEKPEDAAGKSIGAQTGTVQEGWIQDTLVAAGLTAADQVFSYERADQAALDVANGRIELLLMDAEPSIALAEETGLKILLITELTTEGGKSIAIPDGAADLKAELDRIIQELIDDGTVQKIQEANDLP
jgi:polar amino acid transport system substrate-binding protein